MKDEGEIMSAEPAQEGACSAPHSALRTPHSDARFFAVALWLCAAGSAVLLLCPAAFNRRVLTLQSESAEMESRRQFVRNADLERRRDALDSDPSAIEREARNNGYGRADEKPYPITAAEWKAARARLALAAAPALRQSSGQAGREAPLAPSAAGQAILPALMLVILGALAVLFFCDLKVPEPGARR
jgi:hypothetical protein